MKSIELNKDHKEMLLEMCKKLFSEYYTIDIHDGTCDLCLPNIVQFRNSHEWNDWIQIHWFEFCITYLPIRLFHKSNELLGGNNLHIITNNLLKFEDFGRYEINPVDYLYKQFKKLKL